MSKYELTEYDKQIGRVQLSLFESGMKQTARDTQIEPVNTRVEYNESEEEDDK